MFLSRLTPGPTVLNAKVQEVLKADWRYHESGGSAAQMGGECAPGYEELSCKGHPGMVPSGTWALIGQSYLN